jgi:hypothetical protein
MKKLVLCLLALLTITARADEARWVVILSANTTFADAKKDASRFSKASGIPFSMRGMVYDQKGLRYPDNFEEPSLAGGYESRRFNYAVENGRELSEFLSIEKSDDYPGFKPGYFIVVASIEDSSQAANAVLKKFTKVAEKPYVKKTTLYMGCSS